VIEILEILKNYNSKYVQKSVANNPTDILKDNPEVVKRISQSWMSKVKNLDWIIKHSCRTLLKDGNNDILELFDSLPPSNIKIEDIKISSKVKME